MAICSIVEFIYIYIIYIYLFIYVYSFINIKILFIVDLPIKHSDFSHSYVSLPKGKGFPVAMIDWRVCGAMEQLLMMTMG
jgi:hypothetical protein